MWISRIQSPDMRLLGPKLLHDLLLFHTFSIYHGFQG